MSNMSDMSMMMNIIHNLCLHTNMLIVFDQQHTSFSMKSRKSTNFWQETAFSAKKSLFSLKGGYIPSFGRKRPKQGKGGVFPV